MHVQLPGNALITTKKDSPSQSKTIAKEYILDKKLLHKPG
jgi:hypothetical protein